ncbi:MAG: beta-galactosidase, partial [Anaerolinea sp.]|nr:beta-galactosidase [Anaerolinea sp.]
MLYPQTNTYRQVCDLGGFWDFRFDPDDVGLSANWSFGFADSQPIAVTASWNDQFAESRDNFSIGWYQTRFTVPQLWSGQRVFLRFDAVNYLADVWLNGDSLGGHEGGFLPFAFDITDRLKAGENRLVVRVDGDLAVDRVPPGKVGGAAWHTMNRVEYPDANFGFFPYCGIHRPVMLYTAPPDAIQDVTVRTDIDGGNGLVQVTVECVGHVEQLRLTLSDDEHTLSLGSSPEYPVTLTIPDARFWSPQDPHLYTLRVEALTSGSVVDEYTLNVGIRVIAVQDGQVLLNGDPVRLVGFGRHEDFPVVGRGYLPALIVKDFALMRWVGANSFRTAHYPYSEQTLDLADRLGFLIIDEMQAIGLFFREDGLERRAQLCDRYLRELISRDKNHPSVILWCLANEPQSVNPEIGAEYWRDFSTALTRTYSHPAALDLFKSLADTARALDPTRLITMVGFVGAGEDSYQFMDIIGLNRYNGWYTQAGEIAKGVQSVADELDLIYRKFGKPILLSEFGAEALPGHHALPAEMYSEEYQADFLTAYIEMARTKPFVIGEHIWNLTDFKVNQ